MAKMTVLVCDKCQSQDGVETWQLGRGSQRATLDLCSACSEPVAQLLTEADTKPVAATRPRAVTRARAPRQKVMTMEEIEKLKKK